VTTVNLRAEKKKYFDKPQSTSYKRNSTFTNSAMQAEDMHNRENKEYSNSSNQPAVIHDHSSAGWAAIVPQCMLMIAMQGAVTDMATVTSNWGK